ncbi:MULTISPECIES: Tol-Pal system beta propeller repeat protein TolB [Sphingomonadales]|jgi:TolB protein|uniref:TolB protein n=1 Tax=Sphingobium xenophagum TaxID=121428 RepID=A0A401J4I1_SPHXE|nr:MULTISPECIES: Tol-Pal system beta propeller repeat protein TolB [Sphingomonadales]MBA4757558.1 Tol-Pal system protein TolB [Sphingosinicella sp.]GBH31556.1 TolB protein [Sphingobium xenophagum]
MRRSFLPAALVPLIALASPLRAEGPLHVDITQGVASPLLIAVPDILSGSIPDVAGGEDAGAALAKIVRADLVSTGLYRLVPVDGHYSIADDVAFAPFARAGAQALVLGRARPAGNNQLAYDCALYDVFGAHVEASQRIIVATAQWRRAAHKCADMVFAFTTGDPGHFDTRLLVSTQDGAIPGQRTRLVSMDYDGANATELTQGKELVATPRFGPGSRRIVFLSYVDVAAPRLVVADLDSGSTAALKVPAGVPSAPRFSPDGATIVFSLAHDGEADIYAVDLASGNMRQLTSGAGTDTSPCFAPDGRGIVFESNRSGESQLYVMAQDGSDQRRISFGAGGHASPVWSPRGDLIAFTQIDGGALRIGIMKPDGSKERILTSGSRDEDPSWSMSGRAIMFQRTAAGAMLPTIWLTDLTGKVQQPVATGAAASEPAWSGQRP